MKNKYIITTNGGVISSVKIKTLDGTIEKNIDYVDLGVYLKQLQDINTECGDFFKHVCNGYVEYASNEKNGNLYRLKLNDADPELSGAISILPKLTDKKSIFGSYKFKYRDPFYVLATRKEDYFEDIVLGQKITYNPEKISDISKSSITELNFSLNKGITCYEYSIAKEIEADTFLRLMQGNPEMIHRYKTELDLIKDKAFIKDRINYLKKENKARKRTK